MIGSRIILVGLLIAGGFWLMQKELAGQQIHVPYTPADSGKKMFKAYCASCHGVSGTGNGPTATTLRKRPTDLTQLAKGNHGVFPTEEVSRVIENGTIAAHGSSEMPVWGPELSRLSGHDIDIQLLRVHNLVSYIGTLQKH
jgi:mono/diheme cytochrome c family protein